MFRHQLARLAFAGAALVPLVACGACGKHVDAPPEAATTEPAPSEGLVVLTPEQEANARLVLGKATRRSAAGLLSATAQIEPPADGVARIGSRLSGRINTLAAGVGDHVRRGQSLASIDSPDLGRTQADYLVAVAARDVADQNLARLTALHDQQLVSDRDLDDARAVARKAAAEKQAADARLHGLGLGEHGLAQLASRAHASPTTAVTSPLDGVVVERAVALGQSVEPSDTLFVVMDLRTVWVVLDVYEPDLAQIRVGQRATARVAAYSDRAFTGTVANIGAVVEPTTRTIPVRVVVDNADGALKPGMFATVEVAGTAGEAVAALWAPSAAIQRDGERAVVFVPKGDHRYERRAVKVGRSAGDWVQIDEGLGDGEQVVTQGSFLLKAELGKAELGGDD